jgi:hypothetical protein
VAPSNCWCDSAGDCHRVLHALHMCGTRVRTRYPPSGNGWTNAGPTGSGATLDVPWVDVWGGVRRQSNGAARLSPDAPSSRHRFANALSLFSAHGDGALRTHAPGDKGSEPARWHERTNTSRPVLGALGPLHRHEVGAWP